MTNLKKKLASALAVLTLFTYASATCIAASASNFIGDVNNDNKIDNNDTNHLLNYVTKQGVLNNRNNADVNGDGDINISDVVSLMQTVNKGVIANARPITGIGKLQTGKWYSSPNDTYFAVFQGDGNLVVYRKNSSTSRTPCWSSGTTGCDASFCQLQKDGNFVIYDKYNRPVWCTDSYKTPSGLFINNNGELFVYSYKDYCKVWSSANSNGKRIYQPTIKPVHTCSKLQCYCKDNKWYYGCPECDKRDHEVGILEYAERNVPGHFSTTEAAMKRYLELLNVDSKKAEAAVNAYSSMYGLNESSIRLNVTQLDDIDTDFLPDCKAKDIIEEYQDNKEKMNAILGVYDLFNNSNKKTIGIKEFNEVINGLQLAFEKIPLAKETYGNVLEGIKEPAKKSIIAGLKHNYDVSFSSLPVTMEGNDPGSYYFWDKGVTAYDLQCQTAYTFGNGNLTVKNYFKTKFKTESQADAAYTVFKNIKCIQAATGESFWELVNQLF